mgnify:FL=1
MDILLPGPATVTLGGTNVGEYDAAKALVAKGSNSWIYDYIAKAGDKLPAEAFLKGQGLEIDIEFSETAFANLPKIVPGLTLVTSAGVSKVTMGGYSGKKQTSVALVVTPLSTPVGNLMTLTVPRVIPVGDFTFNYGATQHWVGKFMALADIAGSSEGAWMLSWGDPSATADAVAPTISLAAPADGDTGVSAAIHPTFTASEDLKTETVNTGSVILMKDTGPGTTLADVVGTVTLANAGAGTLITFTPTSPLSAGAIYRWILLPTITDLAGNHLAAFTDANKTSGSFTVAP